MGLPFENADYNEDEVGARKIPELTDVVLTNIQNDNVLVYNNGIWENQAQSGGSIITELDDIPGVTITNAQDNQFLKYISGVWVNSTDTDNDTDNLNDLTDTLLTTPFGDDEVIKYLNGKWVNGNIPIEKLSNVHISNLQDGETLRYIHQNARWENAYNIDTLNELSDVTISSNLNNHVLKYNNQLGVYKNAYLNVTDLGDTNITTLANGNTLIYNNGFWTAGNIPLSNFTNGTGISVTGTSPNLTITNTLPDETVILNNGTGISITGAYPEFTITNTYQETDPIYSQSDAANVTNAKIAKWDAAWGWGDHAAQNYLNTSSPAGSITNGTGFLKNNGSGTWTYDNNTYLTSVTNAEIYNLTGLTWSNLNNKELIRRVDATNADGAGMTLHDTSFPTSPQTTYYKDISYFGRHAPLTIPFGVNRYEHSFTGHNQRLIPYSPILLSSTLVSGLYLHHLPATNDYNVRVGVNIQYPSQDFQVGTTLYVDDTNKRVGINQASPSVDLEVLNTMYVDSNTRKVGIVNATPTTTFQVGTTLNVNVAQGRVGIGIVNPQHALDVVGEIRLQSGGGDRLIFNNTTVGDIADVDAIVDGTNGGIWGVRTKEVGGGISEKLRINHEGKLGFRGAIYGSPGDVLTNNASGLPTWAAPTSGPATTLTGSSFDVTVGTYPGNTNIPQLLANGNNNIHVFYAEDAGEAYALLGHKRITSVNLYGGTTVSLFGDGANNVHVFYADIAGGANHLRGHQQITSVNYYGGTTVSLFGNGVNVVHVFYADRAGAFSDDRIKWNETPINTDRAIEMVKKIKFYQYDMLKEPMRASLDPEEPYDPSKCKVAFGVIAQEIEELSNEYPELKDTPFEIHSGLKGVEYDNLFTLLGATTQTLILSLIHI